MKLYEMAEQYKYLTTDLFNEETGEINEQSIERLNSISDCISNKCTNIVKIMKNLDYTADAIEKERKAMQARESAVKNQVIRLKEYLRSNMQECNIDKIECPQFVITLQKNPESVFISNVELIPESYFKIKVEPDITKIKEALKSGIEIPGATLASSKSIRIK